MDTKHKQAEVVKEFGPFPGNGRVHGVTYDGESVWWASDKGLNAMDPDTGEITRVLDVPAHAGTAFDGTHIYQIGDGNIRRIDPATGETVATIPAPTADDSTGMAWAEGSLWVGQFDGKAILQIDPATGKVLRTIPSDRMVTGVTWAAGDLWHATWEEEDSELRRIDPQSGEVLECLELPKGINISGLESDGADRFFCGGCGTGKVRVVKRPGREKASKE